MSVRWYHNLTSEKVAGEKWTPSKIHNLADAKGIKWDNDRAFMDRSERVTGKRHLDKMTPPQLAAMAEELQKIAERAGHWRTLGPHQQGKDQQGGPVMGRTWVKGGLKKFVKLKPHQADFVKAVDKMKPTGGIIAAHGTGTGKTVSSVAAFEKLKTDGKAKRALVITPAGLRTNYLEKGVNKFTHSKGVIVKGVQEVDADTSYVITSYAAFRRNPQAFIDAYQPDTIIADEVHRASNPGGATYKALLEARKQVPRFMGLTASVVQNQPADIVPLSQIASRGEGPIKTKKQFRKKHIKRVKVKQRGVFGGKLTEKKLVRKEQLKFALGPNIHYIEDLDAKEKPPKEVKVVPVKMSKEQIELYRMSMKGIDPKIQAKIKAGEPVSQKEAMGVFMRLMRARQVSNSMSSMGMSPEEAAEKTPKIKQILDDTVAHIEEAPDAQIIMYTNIVHGGVDVLEAGLKARGIKYGVFAGKGQPGVTEKSRQKAVKDYLAGKNKVIVITGAGAEGLSLGNTTLVQLVDGHYNPERINQAEARGVRAGGQAHRPLEERKVQVRRYVSTIPRGFFSKVFMRPPERSVEEWVYATAGRKARETKQVREVLKARSEHEKKKRESVVYRTLGGGP